MTLQQGLFITFEGLDGCGKTTQIDRCHQWLSAQGYAVCLTRNPGATPIGKTLRNILLHSDTPVDPRCELLLYIADRAQHYSEVVLPALNRGEIVLCDRYVDSTLAYQGYGRGFDIELIQTLNQFATYGQMPDITFYLDAPVEKLFQRLNRPLDRIEQQGQAFFQKVHEGFTTLAQANPQRMVTLDALTPIEVLSQQIQASLSRHLTPVCRGKYGE